MPGLGAIYEADPDDQVRILLLYGGIYRPIFWFKVSHDCSIYLGPRYREITRLGYGVARRTDEGLHVSYSDTTSVNDPEIVKRAKLSFHGSGAINTPVGRAYREKLKTIDCQQLLCITVFQHPSAFQGVFHDQMRSRDVCFNYPVDEAHPLWSHLYVSPKGKAQTLVVQEAKFQMNLFFEYSGLLPHDDFVVQFILTHNVAGPWPPATYIVFPAKRIRP